MVGYSWPFFFIFVTQPIFEAWIDTIALIDVFSIFEVMLFVYIYYIIIFIIYLELDVISIN